MRVVLKVTSGPYEGQSILLRKGQGIKVGRTEWADFAVPHDSRLSGVHFSLEYTDQQCRLRDLESTNGTCVNGEQVLEKLLSNGDTILAGHTTFVVEVEQAVDEAKDAPVRVSIPEVPASAPFPSAVLVTVSDRSFLSPILLAVAANARPYAKAIEDKDQLVRREALLAAAWTRQPWLLEYCRALALQPSPADWDALWLLGVLGQPSDVERILTVGRTTRLGSRRFAVYAAYGHPRTVKDLLWSMDSQDPNTAVAAAAAFTTITGAEIDSPQRVTLPPEDGSQPDEFDKEFQEEAFLPDRQKAERHWQAVKDRFAPSVRWRRGLDLGQGTSADVLAQLDMESRYEALLREKYEGTWQGNPQQLGRFPLAALGYGAVKTSSNG